MKIKKNKNFRTFVIKTSVLIFMLIAFGCVMIFLQKKPQEDKPDQKYSNFEFNYQPLILKDKYFNKKWKNVKTENYDISFPNSWFSGSWNNGRSIGICETKDDCQDWKISIYFREQTYFDAINEAVDEINYFKDSMSCYKQIMREIQIRDYRGTLLGDCIVVFNIDDGNSAVVMYINTKNETYLNILSTITIY